MHRIICYPRNLFNKEADLAATQRARKAHTLGFTMVEKIYAYPLFIFSEAINSELVATLTPILCDPVLETLRDADSITQQGQRLEVLLRPGVTNAVANEHKRVQEMLNLPFGDVQTGWLYFIVAPNLSDEAFDNLRLQLLTNPVIHDWSTSAMQPSKASETAVEVEYFEIAAMDDNALMALSEERRTALNLEEMQAIRAYYQKEQRPCSDIELEMIAQTWSEHCVHKTFRAKIRVDDPKYPAEVNNILKSYIKRATDEIIAEQEKSGGSWVLSSFVDNAGIIALDENYEISFKAETHNHPSAIEPFGGANTGVGGVIRDVMGVSARPFAATDVLCFGEPIEHNASNNTSVNYGEGLSANAIIEGVVSGVADYGNKMGIPTVNGSVHYDDRYRSNPLVYCGCVGIAPRGSHPCAAQSGDAIVSLGGRVGRDGIRGATFSSMTLDAQTGSVAGASVQIGDPIVQKKVLEVLLKARDKRLYSAITDCGAGGFSSAVGEMAAKLGCLVDLATIPLKYPGLAPWEVWLSEAQERMVLAVPQKHLAELKQLCATDDVEMTVLGHFTDDKKITILNHGTSVAILDCDFLDEALPQRLLHAQKPVPQENSHTTTLPHTQNVKDTLLDILHHYAVSSRDDIVHQYDYEVQGGTVLRPYDGVREGPQDAAVIRPREVSGSYGVAISNGFNHRYTELDPYLATYAIIDEAMRNAVAVGANPNRIAILDNFCLGDPKRPEVMWDLLESARACYEAAVAYGTPFISGKDSFNNEYISDKGERTAIPLSLLVSALGIVPDIKNAVGSDIKKTGTALYLVGCFAPTLKGSVYGTLFNHKTSEMLSWDPQTPHFYRTFHDFLRHNDVLSCHDVSDGGMLTAIAEMCIGGNKGANIDITAQTFHKNVSLTNDERLFGETNGCFIIEIDASLGTALEKAMQPFTCTLVGHTSDDSALQVRSDKRDDVISLNELRNAFYRK